MKKKIVLSVLLALIFISSYSIPALAYHPDYGFKCRVSEENFPSDTVYIDILFPISTDEECYVDFNSENGEKFGISKDSEIVNYCEDGYVSYTFHVVDAVSNLSPNTSYHLHIPKSIHQDNIELFNDLEDVREIVRDDEYYYSIPSVEYKGETYKKIELLEDSLDITVSKDTWQVWYNLKYEREEDSQFDFEYCCEKFKAAKMVYLDKDGNVLAVSSAAEINGLGNGTGHLNLKLSGKDFTSDPTLNPWWVLFRTVRIIAAVVLVHIIAGAVILTVVLVKKRKRNKA